MQERGAFEAPPKKMTTASAPLETPYDKAQARSTMQPRQMQGRQAAVKAPRGARGAKTAARAKTAKRAAAKK
jgi:hypothetical protein